MRRPSILGWLLVVPISWAPNLCAASTDNAPRQDPPKSTRESLQEFLQRLKSHQTGQQSGLKSGLDAILHTMESDALARRLEALDQSRAKLLTLGPEVAPLLLDNLDPGADATDALKLRSLYIVRALQEFASPALTDRLVQLAQTGSTDGRRNAIAVLGFSPEPERAAPVLVGIVKSNSADLRESALTALARLDAPEAEKTLGDALADANPAVVKATLYGLAAARNARLAPRILKLIEVPRDAVQYIDAVLWFYAHVPEAADKHHVLALARLAQDFSPPPELRARILEAIPTLTDKVDNDTRKLLKEMGESPTKEVKEAALIALVLLGDKSSRKDLFADVEILIERNKNYAQNYESRARLYYKIGEWRDAAKDYTNALKLSASDFRARPEEAYIGLARCQMQLGKLKEAKDTLEKAPISLKELQELAKEPVFAKLAENPKFRTVFRLDG